MQYFNTEMKAYQGENSNNCVELSVKCTLRGEQVRPRILLSVSFYRSKIMSAQPTIYMPTKCIRVQQLQCLLC